MTLEQTEKLRRAMKCECGVVYLQEGDESYSLYKEERDGILSSLKRRAQIMADCLNKLEGVTCVPTEGGTWLQSLPPSAASLALPLGSCQRLLTW